MSLMDQISEKYTTRPADNPTMDHYGQAFYNNIGLLDRTEQERLRNACVAIPGLGGIGSVALIALARLGVGKFRIADYGKYHPGDTFQPYGTTTETNGRSKVAVMADAVRAINPEAKIDAFNAPVTDSNIDEFLSGADIVVDGLNFFLPNTRRLLYRKAREYECYVVLPSHLGFSATLQTFSPRGIDFDDYFNLSGNISFEEKIIRFFHGLAPARLQRKYMKINMIDFNRKRLPAVGNACQIAANMAVTEVLSILLQRKAIKCAPYYSQFDTFRMKYKTGYLWMGNRNPVQRLKIALAKISGPQKPKVQKSPKNVPQNIPASS